MFLIFLSRYKNLDVYWTQIRHSKHQCNESLTMMRLQEIYLTKDKKIHPKYIMPTHNAEVSVFTRHVGL